MVIYRNGQAIAVVADDGSYTDVIQASSGRLTYQLCEEGTARCSNEARSSSPKRPRPPQASPS